MQLLCEYNVLGFTFLTIYNFCESDIYLHLILILAELYVTN
jgi:hypothetical protein